MSAPRPEPRETFAAALPAIEDALSFIRHRQGCSRDEGEEFASYAHLKLLERDCAVLARFQGRSDLRTFLVVVLHRMFLDFRRERWGVWRPSAEARRLGPAAVTLDRLLTRDGATFDEAIELVASSGRFSMSREEIRFLAERLPRRARRRMEGEEALCSLAAPGETVEDLAMSEERARRAREVRGALRAVLARLCDEDAAILRLRFEDGLTVARVGELLGLEAKPLYRRVQRLLELLRDGLLADGVTGQDVAELIEAGSLGEPSS